MEEFLNAASDGLISAMATYNIDNEDFFIGNNMYEVVDKLGKDHKTSLMIFNITSALEAGDNFQVIKIIERTIWRLKNLHNVEFKNLKEAEGGNVDPAYIVIEHFSHDKLY